MNGRKRPLSDYPDNAGAHWFVVFAPYWWPCHCRKRVLFLMAGQCRGLGDTFWTFTAGLNPVSLTGNQCGPGLAISRPSKDAMRAARGGDPYGRITGRLRSTRGSRNRAPFPVVGIGRRPVFIRIPAGRGVQGHCCLAMVRPAPGLGAVAGHDSGHGGAGVQLLYQ